MSPIVAHSVANFYGCKPNLKNRHIFEALVFFNLLHYETILAETYPCH